MGFLSTPSARRATTAPAAHICSTPYFYPRPPRGGRRVGARFVSIDFLFLSTPSARRATHRPDASIRRQQNFYPRPPRGGRPRQRSTRPSVGNFYPRPPRGGRPSKTSQIKSVKIYFYPRPPRGGRRILAAQCTVFVRISIHALREEGDAFPVPGGSLQGDFYPRPPRGGRPESVAGLT